jgi:predicted nucleotidyltransferase
MNWGLNDAAVAAIRSVLARHPEVERATLYGSRAKGTFKPGSDIDLTLIGPGLTMEILGRIQSELEEGSLPYHIDLSILSQISHAELLDHINRVGVVFYDRANSN